MFKIKINKNNLIQPFLASVLLSLITPVLFFFYFKNRLLPGTHFKNINLSFKTPIDAHRILSSKVVPPDKIKLISDNEIFFLSLPDINFSYDFIKTVEFLHDTPKIRGMLNLLTNYITRFNNKNEISLEIKLNQEKLEEYIHIISEQLDTQPSYPSVNISDNKIFIKNGDIGKSIDKDNFNNLIIQKLKSADFSPAFITFKIIDPRLKDNEFETIKKRAGLLIGKKIILKHYNGSITLADNDIVNLLGVNPIQTDIAYSELINTVKNQVERDPQNAVFRFQDSQNGNGKVVEFIPAKNGIQINETLLINQIKEAVLSFEAINDSVKEIDVSVYKISPAITTDSINNFGIKELLGTGVSKFSGSIPARIHNIGVASSKFNGILIAPDEIFSFNNTLGDVSTLTGYKQAYIIKDGKTVLGDGGGVCQVSTTMFRAVLDTGLPIIERRAHSYRVSYYEQNSKPGLDATVYNPTTDFKFKNDTPAYILIQTTYDPKKASLVFEFYGTDDGRKSIISTPILTDISPPPEDLYINDPSLPLGETKQIDHKAWGAKANFDYFVIRDGETIYQKTFYSDYQPWQAKFLRGTKSPS